MGRPSETEETDEVNQNVAVIKEEHDDSSDDPETAVLQKTQKGESSWQIQIDPSVKNKQSKDVSLEKEPGEREAVDTEGEQRHSSLDGMPEDFSYGGEKLLRGNVSDASDSGESHGPESVKEKQQASIFSRDAVDQAVDQVVVNMADDKKTCHEFKDPCKNVTPSTPRQPVTLTGNFKKDQPLEDTSQIERRNQNHSPFKRRKLGDIRYISKKVSGLFVIAVLWSQFSYTMAASVTGSPLTTEPALEDLPYPCTDNGSQPDDTWLDRKEVNAMTKGYIFDGSDKGYTDICPNAFHGLYLREIILSRNSLSELPDHMCKGVQNLHRVVLDYNHFTSVPAALNECSDVEFIDISYNDIREIPRGAISNVTSLQGLDVSGNKNLGQYPPDIFFIPYFRSLTASNTAISSPPHPPCVSSEKSYNYSLKCSEEHVELSSESLRLTFYFENLSAFYENWDIENCSDPEGMQFHFDCKTSTPEPVESESSTGSMVSVTTKSILHSDDDPSSLKNDNKTVGEPILFILGVIFCIFSSFLKALERRSVHIYVTVGLLVILIALCIGTFVVAWVYFGTLVALTCLVLELTVIAFLAYDLYFSSSSH